MSSAAPAAVEAGSVHPARRTTNGLQRQSDRDPAVQFQDDPDANVPHDLVRVLSVLLRVVWDCAAHGRGPGRSRTDQGAGRQHDHRLGCDHRDRPAGDRMAVRQDRPAKSLYVAAGTGFDPGDDDRLGGQLRDVLAFSPRHRRDRCVLCHHPVPHLRDVRAEHRRHGQRDDRRLGQPWRRRHADGHAPALRGSDDLRR